MKKLIGKAFLLTIIIEIFLFNYRSLESIQYEYVECSDYDISPDATKNGTEVTFSDEFSYIEVNDIGRTVNNIYLNSKRHADDGINAITVLAIDEGNSATYYQVAQLNLNSAKTGDRYIRVHLYGKAKSIRIYFNGAEGQTITIHEFGFNKHKPIELSPLRAVLLFGFLLCLLALYPNNEFGDVLLVSCGKKPFVITLIIQLILVSSVTFYYKDTLSEKRFEHHLQYQKLAVAMANGRISLPEEPSKGLVKLKNPYDRSLREKKQVDYMWDTAYYNGKYYVYFGVVPVVMAYLPFYLLTGKALPNIWAVYIAEIAIIIGILLFFYKIAQKFFPAIRLKPFLLLENLLLMGTGIVLICTWPVLYTIPIAWGLAFMIWGLMLCMSVKGNDLFQKAKLFLGCLCLALVAGCRPQMLLSSFFLLPQVAGLLRKGRKGVATVGVMALPYILVAIALMYYNYARFQSPFDFGSRYNLTTDDLTLRKFVPDRIPLGVFTYLLQPPVITAKYPYLNFAAADNYYNGKTIWETMCGGFLWFHPITMSLLVIKSVKNRMKERKIYYASLVSVLFGIIIIITDTQMAGLVSRYTCDFGFFLCLPAVCVFMSLLCGNDKAQREGAGNRLLYIITIMTIVMNILLFVVLDAHIKSI